MWSEIRQPGDLCLNGGVGGPRYHRIRLIRPVTKLAWQTAGRSRRNCRNKRRLTMEKAAQESGLVLSNQRRPKPGREPLGLYVCVCCQWLHWGSLKRRVLDVGKADGSEIDVIQ
jgi:hypothetical protein